MDRVIFWRNYYPQQRIGEVDSTPGCHHTHQQRNRNHRASDASPQPEGNKLRRLHHPFRLHTVTQLSACRLNIHILLNTVEHEWLKRFSKKCSKRREHVDRQQTAKLPGSLLRRFSWPDKSPNDGCLHRHLLYGNEYCHEWILGMATRNCFEDETASQKSDRNVKMY